MTRIKALIALLSQAFAAIALIAFALFMSAHVIDIYRCGGGVIGWMDGGHLESMRGWRSIEMDHPRVMRGILPGVYYVDTDRGTYSTNYSADEELLVFLESKVETR